MSPTTPRRHRFDDPDAYDSNGILKDGHAVSISMTMMDSTEPMIISTKGYIPEEIRARMYDGIPGVTASRTSDGRRRRKVQQRDPMGRESGSFEEEDASPHRPGFRTTDAARSACHRGSGRNDS
jgi:hypothetical protein